jgi:hypothetical protein
MPPIFSRLIAINQEWAELLIGLRMNIPNSSWAGNTCLLLNVGAISHLYLHQQNELYFQLELGNDKGIYHATCYNAVLLYGDKSHLSFVHYCLPFATIPDPADDQVHITRCPIVEMVDDGINFIAPPCNNNFRHNPKINNGLVVGVKDGM